MPRVVELCLISTIDRVDTDEVKQTPGFQPRPAYSSDHVDFFIVGVGTLRPACSDQHTKKIIYRGSDT